MRLSMFTMVAAIAAATIATAQPRTGDLIIATDTGIHYVDPANGVIRALVRESSPFNQYRWLAMDELNTGLITIRSGLSNTMFRVASTGKVTTLVNLTAGGRAAALEATGSWIVVGAGATGRDLLAVASTRYGTFATTARGVGGFHEVVVNEDHGELIMIEPLLTGAKVVQFDVSTERMTTLATGLRSLTGVDHDQRTGRTYLTSTAEQSVFTVDRSGVKPFTSLAGAAAVKVDDLTGEVYVASGNEVVVFDASGARLRTLGPFANINAIHHIERWGRRKLAPTSSSLLPGSAYLVRGAFQDSPNASYVCGIGFAGMRPGFPVPGGRTVNVQPDPLFFQSVAGDLDPFTSGFVGRTTAAGRFTASFALPLAAAGIPIVMVAAVANPLMPGGVDVAEALAIPLR